MYDENGIRTTKIINGETTYFNTRDGVVLSQSDSQKEIYFQYDTNGIPLGFILNNKQFFYITNQLGDVMGITDDTGVIWAEYRYDEWGAVTDIIPKGDNELANAIATAVAEINPLRYRGYYYDTETGYYYLQSRYYDPSICRFINSDMPEILETAKEFYTGTNLFAYCCNNPVNYADPYGKWGEDVHNGYSTKGKKNYYYTFFGNYATAYGTYCWAIGSGFTSNNARTLGKYCIELDKKFSSTMYFSANLKNVERAQRGLPLAYDYMKLRTYQNWQYYHFNGSTDESSDTRTEYAERRLSDAIKNWKNGKKDFALKMLGYGLHAIQDVEAHGQIGRGKNLPQHIVSSINTKKYKADNINYDWVNSEIKTTLKKSNKKTRLIETSKKTHEYLNRFIKKIGGKNKI